MVNCPISAINAKKENVVSQILLNEETHESSSKDSNLEHTVLNIMGIEHSNKSSHLVLNGI